MDLPQTSKYNSQVLDCQKDQQGISTLEQADVNPHSRSVVTAMDQSFEVTKSGNNSGFAFQDSPGLSGRDITNAENQLKEIKQMYRHQKIAIMNLKKQKKNGKWKKGQILSSMSSQYKAVRRKSEKIILSTQAKVVVLGEERVGKTSIIKGYCVGGRDVSEQGDSHFDPSEQMTLDACAFLKYEYLGANEDHEMIIDIWDTAG